MSDKKDLTRIEDLSEFLHEEDPEVDKKLEDEELAESQNEDEYEQDNEELQGLDDLEEEDPPLQDGFQNEAIIEENADPTNPDLLAPTEEELKELEVNPDDEEELDDFNFSDEDDSNEQDWQESPDDHGQWGEEESFEKEDEDQEPSFDGDGLMKEAQPLDDQAGFEEYQEQELANDSLESEEETAPPLPVTPPSQEPPPQPKETKENFQDLKEFAQNMTYGAVGAGGNPAFSVMVKNIQYEEDAEDILSLLKEHQILNDDNLQTYQQSLENGTLLISQISEYSAIYLAHRLRRYDLDIQVGLADEIHTSKSYTDTPKGLASKNTLKQNKEESFNLDEHPTDYKLIQVTTTPGLEGHEIKRYLAIISQHSLMKESELESLQDQEKDESSNELSKDLDRIRGLHGSHDEQIEQHHKLLELYTPSLQQVYGQLVERLKSEAIKHQANAIVGISFHLTPLIDKHNHEAENYYKITCTGNAVWAISLAEER